MRVALLAVGLLVLKASAAGAPAADLRGTARAGDRPQQNAVAFPLERLGYDTTGLTYSLRQDTDTRRP